MVKNNENYPFKFTVSNQGNEKIVGLEINKVRLIEQFILLNVLVSQ